MFKALARATRRLDHLQTWAGFFIGGATAMSWLIKQLDSFALGWSEAVLLGIAAACVVTLVLSAALASWRFFNPLERKTDHVPLTAPPDLDMPPEWYLARQLHVGFVSLWAGKLESEHVLEVAVNAFNGADANVSVSMVKGSMSASFADEGGNQQTIALPAPSWLADRSPTEDIGPLDQFMIVLEQGLRPAMAKQLIEALSRGRIAFDLDGLDIIVEKAGGASTRLKIWGGIQLTPRPEFRTDRIIKGRGNITL